MTDSTQEREARNYIKEIVADLETELEMYEQALTRANAAISALESDLARVKRERNQLTALLGLANAVIETVLAADQPVRDWLADSMKACSQCLLRRSVWHQCTYHEGAEDAVNQAFELVERTIRGELFGLRATGYERSYERE